jgi:hypothetical protein
MKSFVEERFPHLLPKLVASWGDRDAFDEVMRDLMFDRRGGRIGFPIEAWEELRFLQKLHQLLMRIKHGNIDEPLPDELKWV